MKIRNIAIAILAVLVIILIVDYAKDRFNKNDTMGMLDFNEISFDTYEDDMVFYDGEFTTRREAEIDKLQYIFDHKND